MTIRTNAAILLLAAAMLSTAACGGGGGSGPVVSHEPETKSCPDGSTVPADQMCPAPPAEPQPVERLPFPYTPSGNYNIDGLPRLAVEDARQMPVYQDRDRLLVGVDQGARYIDTFTVSDVGDPDFSIHRIGRDLASTLQVVGMRGDFEIRHGRLSDGVGEQVVSAYLAEAVNGVVQRYGSPPLLRIIGPASAFDMDRTIRAVQLVNAALPEGARVQVVSPAPGFSLRDNVSEGGYFQGPGETRENAIDVEFVPENKYRRGEHSAAVTWGWPVGQYAYIQFNMGANSYSRDHEAVTLLAHEIMHALGVSSHVSAIFASIMEGTGAIHHAEQDGVRKPLSLLYPVDREALQALYGRLDRGDDPTDFGPWEATTLRIDGNGPHANFGVALRNGYAEPWAYGLRPTTTLANNRSLSGSATWTGALLGLTPSAESVAGDAEVGVNLATMRGTAQFTALESWTARSAPSGVGSGTQWLDGDLAYTISVRGNSFKQTGGDTGILTGIFVGRSHEGAAGTLERSDLTAAFGASR